MSSSIHSMNLNPSFQFEFANLSNFRSIQKNLMFGSDEIVRWSSEDMFPDGLRDFLVHLAGIVQHAARITYTRFRVHPE